MNKLRILASLLALAAALPCALAGDVPVTWKGKKFTTDAILVDLPPAQKKAVVLFADWAKKAGYRMDFDAQSRVLLITPVERSRLVDTQKIVAQAETWFDTLLPMPEHTAAAASEPAKPEAPAKKPAPAPIPEDPESAPAGGGAAPKPAPAPAPTGTAATKNWGSGSIEPDTQTAVMIIVKDEKEYATLLDSLGLNQPYLAAWLETARKQQGFVLEDPLAGAYIENASGQAEWSPDHELLNRIVQLMTLRRFGQQPNWIVQGLAWDGEMAFDGGVYCFPYRKEFVFAAEHTAWPTDVKLLLKDSAGKPIELPEITSWKRGTWDNRGAKLAWGLVHQMLAMAPGKLSLALEDLRRVRDEKDRRATSSGQWERVPGYEIPVDVQATTLKKHFGADVMKTATNGMRSGKDAKPARSLKDKPDPGEKSGSRGR
jgi:hypothetical protein